MSSVLIYTTQKVNSIHKKGLTGPSYTTFVIATPMFWDLIIHIFNYITVSAETETQNSCFIVASDVDTNLEERVAGLKRSAEFMQDTGSGMEESFKSLKSDHGTAQKCLTQTAIAEKESSATSHICCGKKCFNLKVTFCWNGDPEVLIP